MPESISVESGAVAHGVGLFETMRGLEFLEEHWARLRRSAVVLGFPVPPDDVIPSVARDLGGRVRQVAGFVPHPPSQVPRDARDDMAAVRLLWLDANPWKLVVTTGPIPEVTKSRREHGRAITLDRSFARSLPEHKLTSYAVCSIALQRAINEGADEALFVNEDGVLEGTSTNIFAVTENALITAPANILPGIVRNWVIAEAARMGVPVEERAPTVDELRNGGFMTSSLTTLAPLRALDGEPCKPPGAIFAELRSAWESRFPSAT